MFGRFFFFLVLILFFIPTYLLFFLAINLETLKSFFMSNAATFVKNMHLMSSRANCVSERFPKSFLPNSFFFCF